MRTSAITRRRARPDSFELPGGVKRHHMAHDAGHDSLRAGKQEVYGEIKEETLEWMEECLKEAVRRGNHGDPCRDITTSSALAVSMWKNA